MSETPVNIKVREVRSESGQVFRVLAISPSTRIVGTVELLIPLEPGSTLKERVGADKQQEILDLAQKLVRMVADAVENPAHVKG